MNPHYKGKYFWGKKCKIDVCFKKKNIFSTMRHGSDKINKLYSNWALPYESYSENAIFLFLLISSLGRGADKLSK